MDLNRSKPNKPFYCKLRKHLRSPGVSKIIKKRKIKSTHPKTSSSRNTSHLAPFSSKQLKNRSFFRKAGEKFEANDFFFEPACTESRALNNFKTTLEKLKLTNLITASNVARLGDSQKKENKSLKNPGSPVKSVRSSKSSSLDISHTSHHHDEQKGEANSTTEVQPATNHSSSSTTPSSGCRSGKWYLRKWLNSNKQESPKCSNADLLEENDNSAFYLDRSSSESELSEPQANKEDNNIVLGSEAIHDVRNSPANQSNSDALRSNRTPLLGNSSAPHSNRPHADDVIPRYVMADEITQKKVLVDEGTQTPPTTSDSPMCYKSSWNNFIRQLNRSPPGEFPHTARCERTMEQRSDDFTPFQSSNKRARPPNIFIESSPSIPEEDGQDWEKLNISSSSSSPLQYYETIGGTMTSQSSEDSPGLFRFMF